MDVSIDPSLRTPSRRVRARLLADQLRAVLERQIDEGRLKAGDQLPAERELAARFGASRNVVRTALGQLFKDGKITRHVGRGTIVAATSMRDLGVQRLRLSEVSPAELLEFRLAFEPGLADAIVRHASNGDLQVIKDCVEQGDRAKAWEDWEHCDRSFHCNLVAATHNRLAISIYSAVIAVRHKTPWLKMKRGSTTARNWSAYQDDHRRIAQALLARDAGVAMDAIRTHLQKVRAKMLGD